MLPFDVFKVKLNGKNLIEASAGTGKTYSIAILFLRLIIENELQASHPKHFFLKKILLVTYTKAAAAELHARVRLFVKEAYLYANGQNINDENIKTLIDSYKTKGIEVAKIAVKLKTCLLNFDEIDINTIHGFFGQILSEFAFESNFSFGASILEDTSEIIVQHVNEFYRKEISTLPKEILETIDYLGIKNSLPKIFENLMNDQVYFDAQEETEFNLLESFEEYKQLKAQYSANIQKLSELIQQEKTAIIEDLQQAGKFAVKAFEPLLDEPEKLISKYLINNSGYIQKLVHPVWSYIREINEEKNTCDSFIQKFKNKLIAQAIKIQFPKILQQLAEQDHITFSSLILTLRDRLLDEKNISFLKLIQSKYSVVFIDEFQDTDQAQFEIFEKLFIQNPACTLFLIGDPKQSIYAFRNSDIQTYLEIKGKIKNIFSMEENFRSTPEMVNAVNEFYSKIGVASGFFYNENQSHKITYEPVRSNNKEAFIESNGEKTEKALHLFAYKNNDLAINNLVNAVAQVLNPANNYQIWDKQTKSLRAIKTSDIGILVKINQTGDKIKNALNDLNIPAVKLKSGKILEAAELNEIIIILEAVVYGGLQAIRKALLLTFLRPEEKDYNTWYFSLDENEALLLFSKYHLGLDAIGLIGVLNQILEDFSIRQKLNQNHASLRKLANIEQLIQVIHKNQYQKGWTVEEVLSWLKLIKSNPASINDSEYALQLESDEEAVKITTIHSSKGLEYNLVFIFGLHGNFDEKGMISFKLPNESDRFFADACGLDASILENYSLQSQQESARLIYVALTRAVYQTQVFYSTNSKADTWNTLINKLPKGEALQYIHLDESNYEIAPCKFQNETETLQVAPAKTYNKEQALQCKSKEWRMSYSALTQYESHNYPTLAILPDEYDHFIFNQLPKGKEAGLVLHELFEYLDFTKLKDYSAFHPIAKRALYAFNDEEKKWDWSPWMRKMVEHCLLAHIQFENEKCFTLSEIASSKKINELQFNYWVNNNEQLDELIAVLEQEDASLQIDSEALIGLMSGFIDLFFEHEGRFYILDWKSNYLGFQITDYEPEKLHQAMTSSNYHLQYLIYTVAVYQYLKLKKIDFDYEKDFGGVIYVYLRGARAGTQYGIFTHKPKAELIHKLLQHFELETA